MDLYPRDLVNKHMGYLFLDCMNKRLDAICQIDAATGEKETNASVLSRSIRLARCFRNIGLQPGDVLSLSGKNHLDLHIPFYAGLLNGLPVSGVDPWFKFDEIKPLFKLLRPKIAFCDKENHDVYKEVIHALGLNTKVVTFGEGERSMKQFVETHDTNESLDDFKPAEFDLDKVYAFLISTSGTSGKLKLAAVKHENMIYKINIMSSSTMMTVDNSGIDQITLALSPIHWFSAYFYAIGVPFTRRIKLQTSNSDNFEHVIDTIHKYKPQRVLFVSALIPPLLNRKEDVHLSCFRVLILTGGKVHPDTKSQIRSLLHKNAVLLEQYGMTEALGLCLAPNINEPEGSCGRRISFYRIKLVDTESEKEILQPNIPGECWIKGPMFSEYYNDPEETARIFSEDGYYKTGDLLYFDKHDNFYYVDRIKHILKCKSTYIIPTELEEIIQSLPAVRAVYVCGVPDPHDGQRPVACVVTHEGYSIAAQEIKDLVAQKFSRNKHLTGGVFFLDAFPMTSTGKVAHAKLLEMISKLPKH